MRTVAILENAAMVFLAITLVIAEGTIRYHATKRAAIAARIWLVLWASFGVGGASVLIGSYLEPPRPPGTVLLRPPQADGNGGQRDQGRDI